ncbi:hypothetical protein OSSY52_09150 [Tepiditoga spiralis]|uniref:HD-GYP domain-containing protein n=1 Tax=Tepiditoga spiralis TaxID=2108365 RepID=A0A7G1G6L1_9BACT|nr:HD domain-containing phosphohydrolase [Tepiditoga spiralis]BBE30774.1 hypothetical protein OSSY52_09150 [Tepiditoga spiralis]
MSEKLKSIFQIFNQNEKILRYSVSVFDKEKFHQIIYYKENKFNDDYIGVEFNFSDELKKFIYNDNIYFYKGTIKLKNYFKDYWFLFENISEEYNELNIFVFKIYAPFINLKELLGIVVFFSKEEISEEIEILFQEINIELSEAFYIYRKKFLKINYTHQFLTSFIEILKSINTQLYYHSLGVADTATIIAESMGYSYDEIEFVRNCGLIHDIGKVWIPKSLIDKRGPLSKEEFELVKIHTDKLEEMLNMNTFMKKYVKVAKLHHERLDGSGYYGLKDDEIPEESRILAIADIFDALTHERSYRDAFTLEQSLAELEKMAKNKKIDKDILNVAIHVLPKVFSGDKISTPSNYLMEKSVYIQDIIKKENFIKGVIIGVHKDILNINIQDFQNIENGKIYLMTYENNDIEEKTKIKVLSTFENQITVRLETYKEIKENYVKILWYKDINITKLSSAISNFENINILNYPTFKVKMLMLGGNSITIELEELIINESDIILISFEAYDLKVRALCKVTLIKQEKDFIRATLDFFNMNDKQMRKIFQVIFKRQIELRLNF